VSQKETYSFSKLSAYDQCPRMWELTYREKAPKLKGAFSEYGTLLHSILERYERGELPLSALADTLEWEWDQVFASVEFPPNKYVDLAQSYKEQAMAFLQRFKGLPADVHVLGVEQHFEIPISDFVLQGFIDLAYQRKEKLAILDWKTAKAYSKSDLLHKQRQPYLYSLWVKDQYGSWPDELHFHHIRDNKRVVIPFSEDDQKESVEWATKQVETLRKTWVFPEKPSEFFCRYICSVRGSCKYGRSNAWK